MPITCCINFPTTKLPSNNIGKTKILSLNHTRVLNIDNIPSPTPSVLRRKNFCRLNCLTDPTTTVSPLTNLLSPMDLDKHTQELEVAVKAVHMACLLSQRLQKSLVPTNIDQTHFTNDDFSVTIADWCVQATMSWILSEAFGSQSVTILAEEENVQKISMAEANEILERVLETINQCLADAPRFGLAGPAEPLCSKQIMEAIKRCKQNRTNSSRVWALSSVDSLSNNSTMGFARGDQYAIALSMIEDGVPVLGVLGCPNYPLKKEWFSYDNGYQRILSAVSESGDKGCVIYAKRDGGGAWMQPLLRRGENMLDWSNSSKQIKVSSIDSLILATFFETVDGAKWSYSFADGLAPRTGHRKPALHAYKMVKYAAIAKGDAEAFMKFGKEKIWDHAAGVVIIQEAGGVVSDAGGEPLNFSNGIYLQGLDRGIIACSGPQLHDSIIRAVDASWTSSCL